MRSDVVVFAHAGGAGAPQRRGAVGVAPQLQTGVGERRRVVRFDDHAAPCLRHHFGERAAARLDDRDRRWPAPRAGTCLSAPRKSWAPRTRPPTAGKPSSARDRPRPGIRTPHRVSIRASGGGSPRGRADAPARRYPAAIKRAGSFGRAFAQDAVSLTQGVKPLLRRDPARDTRS